MSRASSWSGWGAMVKGAPGSRGRRMGGAGTRLGRARMSARERPEAVDRSGEGVVDGGRSVGVVGVVGVAGLVRRLGRGRQRGRGGVEIGAGLDGGGERFGVVGREVGLRVRVGVGV